VAVKEVPFGTELRAEKAVGAKSACRINFQRYYITLFITIIVGEKNKEKPIPWRDSI
jgi:hypothetical protein